MSSFFLELKNSITDDPDSIMVSTANAEDETIINFIKSLPNISSVQVYNNLLVSEDKNSKVYERKYQSYNKFTNNWLMTIIYRTIILKEPNGYIHEPTYTWTIDGNNSRYVNDIIHVLYLKYKDNGAIEKLDMLDHLPFVTYVFSPKNKDEKLDFNVNDELSRLYEEAGFIKMYGGADVIITCKEDEKSKWNNVTNIYSYGSQSLVASIKDKMAIVEGDLSDTYRYYSTQLTIYNFNSEEENNIHSVMLQSMLSRFGNDLNIEKI